MPSTFLREQSKFKNLNPLRESQRGTAPWETKELKHPARLHNFKATGLSVDLEGPHKTEVLQVTALCIRGHEFSELDPWPPGAQLALSESHWTHRGEFLDSGGTRVKMLFTQKC